MFLVITPHVTSTQQISEEVWTCSIYFTKFQQKHAGADWIQEIGTEKGKQSSRNNSYLSKVAQNDEKANGR
jgi:hypothetical protein